MASITSDLARLIVRVGVGGVLAYDMALTATARDAADGPFSGGYEVPAALGVCAGVLALTGPRRISVDHLLGNRLANRPATLASLFATVSTTGLVVLRRLRGARS